MLNLLLLPWPSQRDPEPVWEFYVRDSSDRRAIASAGLTTGEPAGERKKKSKVKLDSLSVASLSHSQMPTEESQEGERNDKKEKKEKKSSSHHHRKKEREVVGGSRRRQEEGEKSGGRRLSSSSFEDSGGHATQHDHQGEQRRSHHSHEEADRAGEGRNVYKRQGHVASSTPAERMFLGKPGVVGGLWPDKSIEMTSSPRLAAPAPSKANFTSPPAFLEKHSPSLEADSRRKKSSKQR